MVCMSTDTESPKPKRHWLRFSLRTMLVFMLLVGVGMGMWAKSARKQRRIVQWVESHRGGMVFYEHEGQRDGYGGWEPLELEDQPPPSWRAWLGKDYEWNVVKVDLYGSQESDIKPLAGLTKLKALNLPGTKLSDLTPIAGLVNLEELYLWDTQVSDITPLAGLTKLVDLSLQDTQVSNLKPLAELTNLTWLDLRNTPVSDLKPLAGLTKLQGLDLGGTNITEQQVEKLRSSLPDCEIAGP